MMHALAKILPYIVDGQSSVEAESGKIGNYEICESAERCELEGIRELGWRQQTFLCAVS